MSGLLALLDDVAALAKLAAAQVDDIAAKAAKVGAKSAAGVWDDAAKAGAKSAGVVIDDAAVTPQYVQGLPAAREIPIVARIARGSLFNKLIILLPAALLLDAFLPWLLNPLLLLGGAYLCFEGAEKIIHHFAPAHSEEVRQENVDPAHLEEARVAGAIKTDFILSAEIMTIALSEIETGDVWSKAIILAIVAVGITGLVYGSVLVLVKADDVGLKLSQIGRISLTRKFGMAIVKSMPYVMTFISTVGTVAMLWVGGSIVIHSIAQLGAEGLEHVIQEFAEIASHSLSVWPAGVAWSTKAVLDGVFGLCCGAILVALMSRILQPAMDYLKVRLRS